MALFYLLGTLHDDPTCITMLRGEVVKLLEHLGPPHLVAVEWDEAFAQNLRARRPDLRAALAQSWAAAPATDELLDKCGRTLAWESDVTADLIQPAMPVVWLTEGHQGNVDERADERRQRLTQRLPQVADAANTAGALATIRRNCHAAAAGAIRSFPQEWQDKDPVWFERLMAANVPAHEWALVIVGALHASHYDQHTLLTLLEASGQPCRRAYPCFEPPLGWW